ncbi:MAG TPA: HipA N-terminal domain-containing protein [Pyrinomonadaceae bacterium]|nr:HipA N-terminal domain-containing protein [Pyrinomonadaceae bacterium]
MAIKAIISWLGFHKAVEAPPEVRAEFKLYFEDLLVGTLSVADSLWKFEYSSEFKKQDELRPLVDFPDLNKIYESKELWQFFVMRIPSPQQAEVEEILKREHIREDDAVSLLKRFGERTIANPFRLRAA